MAATNGMRVRDVIKQGTAALKAASKNFSYDSGFKGDAEALLQYAARTDELDPSDTVPAAVRRRFEAALARRVDGEPIPYITGVTDFDGLELTVKPGAFVPRWTSEAMAAEAAKRLARRKQPVHIDLATGIGPVALAVANRVRKASVHACDLSPDAVKLARLNARKLGLRNVRCYVGDLLEPLPKSLRGTVDAITIHPPYVAKHEVRTLPRELRDFEPVMSLTDRSSNGLGLLERTARESADWLRPGGWLIVEIGSYLARDARATVAKHDFSKITSIPGPLRYNRIICAQR